MALETESPAPRRGSRYRYAAPAAPASAALSYARTPVASGTSWKLLWLTLAIVGVAVALFYPSDLMGMVERWATEAGWGHGFIVPLLSCFFIQLKWDTLRQLKPRGSVWGLGVLLVGVCGQVLFRATGVASMSLLSFMIVLFGITLFVFGWEYMKILWLPIAYLGFAMPPPDTLYVKMTMPMQEIAAELGIWLLPLFGGEGVRNGTVIDVIFSSGRTQLFVAQACSGMKMLVAFFALSVALAYSTSRPVWQKLTLAIAALPIAILCNAFRVTITGVLAVKVNPELAKGNQHEYIGFIAMLVPALLMQLGLAWVLDRLFVEVPEAAEGAPA
jgi:exosortase